MEEVADDKPGDVKCDVEYAAGSSPEEFTDCREGLTKVFCKDKADDVAHGEEEEPVLLQCTDDVAMHQGVGGTLYATCGALQSGS